MKIPNVELPKEIDEFKSKLKGLSIDELLLMHSVLSICILEKYQHEKSI